jgi:hypothetical protein
MHPYHKKQLSRHGVLLFRTGLILSGGGALSLCGRQECRMAAGNPGSPKMPVPGPRSRALPAEFKASFLSWSRQAPCRIKSSNSSSVGATRRVAQKPTDFRGSSAGSHGKRMTRPMLSAGNALNTGLRLNNPGNVKLYESPGQGWGLPE